jgi:type I restriction enzyme R subunit
VTDKPEQQARAEIDRLLAAAGWAVQDVKSANIHAARGVALREFQLKDGYGAADYLLYVDAKAAGVIEAKKLGATLTGVELQSGRYSKGLPDALPAWQRPLPFIYESTGAETHFTNRLDPDPRARSVFAFHQPDTLVKWLSVPQPAAGAGPHTTAQFAPGEAAGTFLYRVPRMPELIVHGLWPAQIVAIK